MKVLNARPGLRWLAPLVVLAVVATAGLLGTRASAEVVLPELTAQQLLTKVAEAKPAGFSGEVEQTATLGLPDLSGLGGDQGSDFTSLMSGTHTLRVAYAAPDKSRVAVNSKYGESDIVSDGTQAWVWSSRDNTVLHRAYGTGEAKRTTTDVPTPAEAADRALAAVGDTTDVALARNVTVAERPAYELVLTPKASQRGTLITSVRLAVDGETFVPLRAQVFAQGADPVFSTAFTGIDYTVPAASEFSFTVPKGAKVTEASGHDNSTAGKTTPDGKHGPSTAGTSDVKQVGSGWTTVVVTKAPTTPGGQTAPNGRHGEDGQDLQQVLGSLPKVSGSWGSGRLLAGTAFSAVLTDDGRLAVGMVTPETLYAALG